MLSGYSDSPTPPSSVPETSLSEIPGNLLETLDLITGPFADVPLKGSRSPGPLLDIFEALSPDTCMPTLQEFLNDPNLLDGMNV